MTDPVKAIRDARWYSVDKTGAATLCIDEADAICEAKQNATLYERNAPHTATQLVPVPDLAALLKELDAAKADAERYRWLRDQDWFDGPMCVLCDPKRVLTKGIGIGADCPSRDRLDTAIDKARASLTPSIGEKG